MYKDLSTKDKTLYTQNGILHMIDRNRRIKAKPERFQDFKSDDFLFDIIFTVEERIFDQVIEGKWNHSSSIVEQSFRIQRFKSNQLNIGIKIAAV